MLRYKLSGLRHMMIKILRSPNFQCLCSGQRCKFLAPGTSTCCCCCLVTKSCLTLLSPMDCSLQGSSVYGNSQVRILVWVAISFSRGYSWPWDQTHVSCIGRWILNCWNREACPLMAIQLCNCFKSNFDKLSPGFLRESCTITGFQECLLLFICPVDYSTIPLGNLWLYQRKLNSNTLFLLSWTICRSSIQQTSPPFPIYLFLNLSVDI